MSLYCSNDGFDGDGDWYWTSNLQQHPLGTKRSRKCCSCSEKIKVGDTSTRIDRWHSPANEIEERIYGDEVPMADWFLCETCGDLAVSLNELGFCFTLGPHEPSLKEQIREYRQETA